MVIEVKKSFGGIDVDEYMDSLIQKTKRAGENQAEFSGEGKKENITREENLITKELVAFELYSLYLKCMQEIPVLTKDKETGKQVPTGVYQFDARSALKALQLLGDAVGLFKDKSTVNEGTQTYEDFLKSGGFDYEF